MHWTAPPHHNIAGRRLASSSASPSSRQGVLANAWHQFTRHPLRARSGFSCRGRLPGSRLPILRHARQDPYGRSQGSDTRRLRHRQERQAHPKGDGEGTADLVIETVVKRPEKKEDDLLGDRKILPLNRFLQIPEGSKFLVFCDVYKGKIDPYRGIQVKADSNMARYIEGGLKLDAMKKSTPERLRFFYDFLDDSEMEIATDAYKEFANADAKDVQAMVALLKPADVARAATWLDKPGTSFKSGLFASLLGYSGDKKYAVKLRALLDDPDRRAGGGVDGILASYVMLEPEAGWKFVRSILADPTGEFPYRHAALRAARYLP